MRDNWTTGESGTNGKHEKTFFPWAMKAVAIVRRFDFCRNQVDERNQHDDDEAHKLAYEKEIKKEIDSGCEILRDQSCASWAWEQKILTLFRIPVNRQTVSAVQVDQSASSAFLKSMHGHSVISSILRSIKWWNWEHVFFFEGLWSLFLPGDRCLVLLYTPCYGAASDFLITIWLCLCWWCYYYVYIEKKMRQS